MTCWKLANTGAHASRENATTASTSHSVRGRMTTSTPRMRPRWSAGSRAFRSFPLDRAGRLAGHVQHHAVDLCHLVGDPGGDAGQDVVGQPGPVRGHRVL